MPRIAVLIAILSVISPVCAQDAHAQDIVGLEDCAKTSGTDKKLGCLQANVEFLHGLIKKRDAVAQARLRDQAATLADTKGRLDQLGSEVVRLRSMLEQVEKKSAK